MSAKNMFILILKQIYIEQLVGNICNNLFIENIQKKFQKKQLHNNTKTHKQYLIINQLFPNNNFKKDKIDSFIQNFIDYSNKQIYQVNSTYHLSHKKIQKDKLKYRLFDKKWMENQCYF